MTATKRPDGEKIVDESVAHYQVEKLADGRVKVSSGGKVSIGQTYYDALESFAQWQQEEIEDSPEHLRERHLESIYHDCVNPEVADVVANDADWMREEVIEDVKDGESISRSGAWLAECSERDIEGLGDRIDVYRKWETVFHDG